MSSIFSKKTARLRKRMKKRIDVLIAERGLEKSREQAKIQVIAGNVNVDGKRAENPSQKFSEDCVIEIIGKSCPYVSRGGLKLEKAIECFNINLNNLICADIGASTGGFTDCMLKNGARTVYSIDVGYGQFDWSLRNDKRVVVLERTNARYLESLPQKIDFGSIDVSFISLKHIIPALRKVGIPEISAVALIKPQFEAGKEKIGKKGVVRDKNVHIEVIKSVRNFAIDSGFVIAGLTFSPIKGPNGNIEFLAYLKSNFENAVTDEFIEKAVNEAHITL